jgi:hypothetical protein
MRRQFGDHIGDGESSRVGIGEDTSDERAQATGTFLSGSGFHRSRGADERPDAAAGFEDAGALEVGIDAGDGVGVDAQLDGQLAHGWKLLAWLETAGRNGGAEAPLELRVKRRAVAWIDGNDAHASYTNVLVQ